MSESFQRRNLEDLKSNKKVSASCNLITQYILLLLNIKTIIKNLLLVLHSSHEMSHIFPENTVDVTWRRNKNLKELTSPSLFPRTIKKRTAQLKNITEDAIFIKNFLYYLLSLLVMLPNANIK